MNRDTFLKGKPIIIELDSTVGDGGNKTLQAAPGAGQRWIVCQCAVWHDDNGGNRDTIVAFGVAGGVEFVRSTVTLAAYTRIDASSTVTGSSTTGSPMPYPIVLNHGDYIQLTVNSLGAGKYSHIDLLVLKQYGVPEWV